VSASGSREGGPLRSVLFRALPGVLAVVASILASPGEAGAQDSGARAGDPSPPREGVASPTVLRGAVPQPEEPEVSPGGAFLRSLLVPGWGHAVTDAHFRGAFYVAAQSGTAWMLGKSIARRREARRFRLTELELARERLQAAGITQPDTLRLLSEQDPRVEAWDGLIEARDQQVEDWAALGIFLLLLGATDAFVAGHLMDRPEPLSLDVAPSLDGGWELSLSFRPGGRSSRP
jgi:hypothetical protein